MASVKFIAFFKTIRLNCFNIARSKKANNNFNDKEMIIFYNILIKMKKKRPHMDINKLMKLLYKEKFDANKFR